MRGRKPPGPEIVDRLQGSPQAKRRAKIILRTLRGELRQVEAAALLGMTPQWFDVQRRRFLQYGLAGLQEQPMGRPRQPVSAEQQRIEELQGDLARLQRQLDAALLRQEIAVVLHGQPERDEKKSAARQARRAKRMQPLSSRRRLS